MIFHKCVFSWRCHLLSRRSYCSWWSKFGIRRLNRSINLISDWISITVQIVDDLSRLCREILIVFFGLGWCHISCSILLVHDPFVKIFKRFSRFHCMLSHVSFGLSKSLCFSWTTFTVLNNLLLLSCLTFLLGWIINSRYWRFWRPLHKHILLLFFRSSLLRNLWLLLFIFFNFI